MPKMRNGAIYPQNISSVFRQTLGCFMEVKRSFWVPEKGKPCLFIQITPETTNHHLPFAYCSLVAQRHTHKNCSQYYLGSIYCNKLCNPLKYKSFPHNPCLCKPWKIFHTFLSHQQEIVLKSLTDTRIFRTACHIYHISAQELLPLTISLWKPFLMMLSPSHRGVSSSNFRYWKRKTSDPFKSQRNFAVSSIRLDFQCLARRMVSSCSVCPGLQNSLSGL